MEHIYYRIIRNDISRSKLITLTTLLFIAAAAMLVSLAAILAVNLAGSIDALMTQAKTPHFMQMHSGMADHARLASFAEQNSNVDEFQTIEFLNIDNSKILIGGKQLSGSVQDNGLCIQSEKFDYLLDLDGKVIDPKDGELYVPLCYMKDGTAKAGDRAVICGKEFTVAGFLRDSQMNSLLATSKRFLVSRNNYEDIKGSGDIEYLIEFRLKDLSRLSEFEAEYNSAGLEANGPTITYPLFKMINAVSDGMMIAVIILVSALVVAIAFMCIRFTLLAKIEDDYVEIGVMKAIGLHVSDIRRIYLAKYAAVAAAGCILGFVLSFAFRGILLENIRLFMGESENTAFAAVLGIIGILLVFIAIIAYIRAVLKRFRKISAAEAIRFGAAQEKSVGAKSLCLSGNRLFDINIFLGIKDVLARKKLYVTMLAVLVAAAFIIIVPQNLYSTVSSESFIRYMGIGNYDLRIDIQQTSDISGKAAEIAGMMEDDSHITDYAVFTTKAFTVMTDSSEERIKIELGDHSIFPIEYFKGRAPAAENEIALSAINADELGKKVGDTITLVVGGNKKDFTVCGIYSDITNGGKTAKAVFTDDSADIMWCILCAELSDKAFVGRKVSEYADRFDYAKVTGIDGFIMQTFGSIISSIKMASYVSVAVALIITILVTLLFMKMLVSKDRYPIAAMKAFGFRDSDITAQYVARSVFVLIIGIVLGTLLANTLGEALAGVVISSFGASSFRFIVDPLSAYLFCPLMMACVMVIATIIGTSGTEKIKISANIRG